jgi:unsaturated rhamnogalacturonyl hydrolase
LGKEFITEDHWARGNGWAAFTLSELVRSIPKTNELSQAAVELYLDLIEACSNYQDTNGLWHQEITEPVTSYAEISGTALILYSIGAGLEAGILPESYRAKFELGLQGLLDYITEDDDVFHTCYGCLCPGNGTKLDYMAHRPVLNDYHAFGPLILAFGQAHALGIHQITQIN